MKHNNLYELADGKAHSWDDIYAVSDRMFMLDAYPSEKNVLAVAGSTLLWFEKRRTRYLCTGVFRKESGGEKRGLQKGCRKNCESAARHR